MGDAKRRRILKEGLEEIRLEGQGVWQIAIYSVEGMLESLIRGMTGDAKAQHLAIVIGQFIQAIDAADPPAMCLLCDHEFSRDAGPLALVILHAYRDDPRNVLGHGICGACWAKKPSAFALSSLVTDYYRKNVINDLREVPQPSEPGHG
jgi:hypothetical protein